MGAIVKLLISVAYAVAVGLGIAIAKETFELEDDDLSPSEEGKFHLVKVDDLWSGIAIGCGLTVGVINYLTPTAPLPLLILFFIMLLGGFGALMVWWKIDGGTVEGKMFAGRSLKEMLPFVFLAVMGFFLLSATSWAMAAKMHSRLLPMVPRLVLVVTLGFFVLEHLCYRIKKLKGSKDVKNHKILRVLVSFLTAFSLAAVSANGLGINGGLANPTSAMADGYQAPDTKIWYKFYNTDLQYDQDKTNNFNFGPAPKEGQSADYYVDDLLDRWDHDPALAAGDMAWADAILGTRYLGTFYESCKGDWAETINVTKVAFMENQMAYYTRLDAFHKLLTAAEKVEVRECHGVTDQMYMNPYTEDSVPDVIVLKTGDQTGHELVFTFNIKGNQVEVAYRIECGYQPTNVAEVMGITPQEIAPEASKPSGGGTTPSSSTTPNKPTTPDSPTPDNPTPTPDNPTPTPEPPTPTPEPPTPTPEPPTPTPEPPTPTPEPGPEKDPTKLSDADTEPNDNTGLGEDTNNPSDSEHSTADQPTNSTEYPSYEAYTEDMKKMEQINNDQNVGGGSNEPSTPPPSIDTTVDNNGGSSAGYGSADTPTDTSAPAAEAGTGKSVNDNPGEAWGGPSD